MLCLLSHWQNSFGCYHNAISTSSTTLCNNAAPNKQEWHDRSDDSTPTTTTTTKWEREKKRKRGRERQKSMKNHLWNSVNGNFIAKKCCLRLNLFGIYCSFVCINGVRISYRSTWQNVRVVGMTITMAIGHRPFKHNFSFYLTTTKYHLRQWRGRFCFSSRSRGQRRLLKHPNRRNDRHSQYKTQHLLLWLSSTWFGNKFRYLLNFNKLVANDVDAEGANAGLWRALWSLFHFISFWGFAFNFAHFHNKTFML